jgi:hypothetical protein
MVSMQTGMELTRSLGHTEIDAVAYDVFAEAHAKYDPATKTLEVALDSYLVPDNVSHLEDRVVPGWLPKAQVDREHVDAEEASDLAKDVFQRWCHKVSHAAPHLRA